jgi:hypothetical protein
MGLEIDKLKWFPNEPVSGDNNFCVGFTVSDVVGNIIGQPCDLEFSYAAGLHVAGSTPTTLGEDPTCGMLGAAIFGALPVSLETFTSQTTSQLYTANFANYTPFQRSAALKNAQNGLLALRTYQDITNYLNTYKQGVSLAMRWYESFNVPNSEGTLPVPSGNSTNHNVGVWGGDEKGLLIKPYLGASWGLGGYCYLPEILLPQIFYAASGFDPNAWRWLTLATNALQHQNLIYEILPQL